MSARQVRMIAPSGYNGAPLAVGDVPELPGAVADRLVKRGRAVEMTAEDAARAAGQAVEPVAAPSPRRKRNRGADAVASAPAADPAAAVETGASAAPGEPAADLPDIGETE